MNERNVAWPLPGLEGLEFYPGLCDRWPGFEVSEPGGEPVESAHTLYFDPGGDDAGGEILIVATRLTDGLALQRLNRALAEEWLTRNGYEGLPANPDDLRFNPGCWPKNVKLRG
jgi:hypothetical protein